jgi:hypothetical protein
VPGLSLPVSVMYTLPPMAVIHSWRVNTLAPRRKATALAFNSVSRLIGIAIHEPDSPSALCL